LCALLGAPSLISLRALHGLDEETAVVLATGPWLALTELGFSARSHDEPPREHPFAVCRALPDLRVLAVSSPRPDTGAWLAGAPVLGQLDRLVIHFDEYTPPAALVQALAERRDLRVIELVDPAGPYLGTSGARATLRRGAATDTLDELVIRCRPAVRRVSFTIRRALEQVLAAAPAALRVLAIDLGRSPTLAARDREALRAQVARFEQLEHASLPWAEAPNRATTTRTGSSMTLRARGAGLLAPVALEAVWSSLRELGVTLDAIEAGTGVRPLGAKPLDKLRAWASSTRVHRLALVHDGGADELSLHRGREPADTIAYARFTSGLGPRELAAWFGGLVGRVAPRHATLDGEEPGRGFRLTGLELGSAWLMYVAPHLETLLPAREVAALAGKLGGLFVVPAKRGYVLGTAATPAEATEPRLGALEVALDRIVIANLPAELDYDLRGRMQAVLGPVAQTLGLPRVLGGRSFEPGFRTGGTPEHALVATLYRPLDAPLLEIALQRRDPAGFMREVVAEGPARTRGQLDKLLATAAKVALAKGEAFFAPKPDARRR
jgi:hypothetical protein